METKKHTARERLELLFDGGTFTELFALRAQGEDLAAVMCAHGFCDGVPLYAFAQCPERAKGVMNAASADKISKLYALAAKVGAPLVGIYDSDGVYVDGTADSLAAYGRLIADGANLSGVVPQISVICGVCAGSAALMAAEADFVLLSEDAEIYLTPPFGTDAAKPQTAQKAGIAAAVCAGDEELMAKAREILRLLPTNNLCDVPLCEYDEPQAKADRGAVERAVADEGSLTELYEGFGDAARTALGTVRGLTCGFVSTSAQTPLTARDALKIARFVRTCDAFSVPVITALDTMGFTDDTDAAKAGSLRAMASLCGAYAEATTIKIAVIAGQACGAAFSAIAGKGAGSDVTLAWEDAVIAPMKPESAVEFLWHDKLKGARDVSARRAELAREYSRTLASAQKAAQLGAVDTVIKAEETRGAVCDALDMLEGKRLSRLPKKHSNIPF